MHLGAPDVLNDLELLGAIVVWAVTVARVRMVTQAHSRLLWLALLTLALGQTLQVEGVYRAVETAFGSPGSAAAVKHGFALFAAANTAAVVETLLPPTTATLQHRRPWGGLALALAISVSPWLISPPTRLAPSLYNRAEWYDTTWRSAVNWIPFLAYLGWALWEASRVSWRFRRAELDRSAARTGVTLVGLGTSIGFAYIVEKVVTILAWWSGHGPSFVEFDQAAEAAVLASSVSLIAIGTGYEAGWDRWQARRRHRQIDATWDDLKPIVHRMREEFPDVDVSLTLRQEERIVAGVAAVHEALRQLTAYAPVPVIEPSATGEVLALHPQG